jgi:hypothetical protein
MCAGLNVKREIIRHVNGPSKCVIPYVKSEPPWGYSVGLKHNFMAAEIIISGLPYELTITAINDLADRYKEGDRFADGDVVEKIVNVPITLRAVDPSQFPEYMGMALDFNGGQFEALQVVWPSRDGAWPWDDGASPPYTQVQTQLWLPATDIRTAANDPAVA